VRKRINTERCSVGLRTRIRRVQRTCFRPDLERNSLPVEQLTDMEFRFEPVWLIELQVLDRQPSWLLTQSCA